MVRPAVPAISAPTTAVPTTEIERSLWAAGHEVVAGMDEVGKGAWAGPLTLVVAVIPQEHPLDGVRDSKQLSELQREKLYQPLAQWCVAWAVGHASNSECDELGMSQAQRLAASRALAGLAVEPSVVLLDGRWDFVGNGKARTLVKGDATCLSIAAASVLAKVTRDRLMRSVAHEYPEYRFGNNKGYPCAKHRAALASNGPTPLHRRSWAFMDNLGWGHLRVGRNR
ncbi:MAG: ribonuclease HII [bacterium]|nr:ribonuclease HII [bacterium]MCY4256894.1 ribonuclease HII [bacterium]